MAEPYSDEELRDWLKRLGTTSEIGYGDMRVIGAVRRVLTERDEARRVAKVLAQRTTASQHDWAEVMTALAYPEVKP